jgi:hypothetical protein
MFKRLTVFALVVAAYALSNAAPGNTCPTSSFSIRSVEHGNLSSADGGRAIWVNRYLYASDWGNLYAPGHTAQVLWVAANGQPSTVTWAEIGVTQGWQGQNVYTYYTARGINYPQLYNELRIATPTPVSGDSHPFAAYHSVDGGYRVLIDGSSQYKWPSLNSPTVDFTVGMETTCGYDAIINRTNVVQAWWRYGPSATWNWVTTGSFYSVGSYGSIEWCRQPDAYKYHLRSQLDPSICSW